MKFRTTVISIIGWGLAVLTVLWLLYKKHTTKNPEDLLKTLEDEFE